MIAESQTQLKRLHKRASRSKAVQSNSCCQRKMLLCVSLPVINKQTLVELDSLLELFRFMFENL